MADQILGKPLPSVASYGDRISVVSDVAYSTQARQHQRLDLYLPSGEGPFPVVVCYFGGVFIRGDKHDMAGVCAFLAANGIAAAAPGYHLADPTENRPGWPDNLYDAKCAVRFLRSQAAKLRLDADHTAALGHSSGAYLALMVGFTPHLEKLEGPGGWPNESSRVDAIVNISGVCDRRAGLGTGTKYLLGPGYENNPELRALASPVVHIGPDSPPVFTLQGAEDSLVTPESAHLLDAVLRQAGVPHQLRIVSGAGHNPISPSTMADVAQWFTDVLKH